MEMITYEDFAKLDLRIATVLEATPVEGADKLLLLKLNIGNGEERQIVAGVKKHYTPEEIVGMQIVILANLAPRKLRGIESNGMLLAASNDNELALLTPHKIIPAGSKVG